MVVSKDNKRRRKETETPPTSSSAAAAATLAVESSPEMPKRTKVQAQRKFAQGQSAPSSTSAYSAVAAAAAAATAAAAAGGTASGPSTSAADSHQQPPIEILPNKCPKPQDFLTFLCFRGTSALPAHLDYLNQGKPKANDVVPPSSSASSNNDASKKKNNSNSSKKKRGRPAKPSNKAAADEPLQQQKQQPLQLPAATTSDKIEAAATTPPVLLAGAVRKRAEVITEGNRRGGRRNETLKRRSNRASNNKEKEEEQQQQQQIEQDDAEQEDDDEDEFFSAHDASSRNGAAEESLSKAEATATQGKRGRQQAAARKTAVASPAVTESSITKEKGPVKRVRQRESPIFIPSPESSGRMTRQRAFFEPVKVVPKQPPDDEADEEQEEAPKPAEHKEKEKEKDKEVKQPASKKANDSGTGSKQQQQQLSKEKTNSSIYAKDAAKQLENGGTASDVAAEQQKALNVFDFSSDDEQPLAKSIKLKKGSKKGAATTTAVAATAPTRGRKAAGGAAKKQQQQQQQQQSREEEKEKVDTTPATTPSKAEEPPKAKRGKVSKKAKAEEEQQDTEIDQQQEEAEKEKKQNVSNHSARPARRHAQAKANKAADKATVERSVSPSPQRNQRPSRKTKEAAAIYMGIIGHKLQLADDEDDDLSLSSFPDIPNVKEMEKMEKEIKKNAAGKSSDRESRRKSPKPTAATKAVTTTTAAAAAVAVVEAPAAVATVAAVEPTTPPEATAAATSSAPRRGRPPKQAKGGASTSTGAAGAATAKPQIEGMLVKKGALALAKAKSEQQQQQQQQKQQQQQQQQQQEKDDSDAEEDFLINEELNETKRKLEKSFSDSDDEPLAIKVPTSGAAAASTSATTTAKGSGSKEETTAGGGASGAAQESSKSAASGATNAATITATTGAAALSGATPNTTPPAATLNCTPPKQLTQLGLVSGSPVTLPGTTQLTMLPLTAKPTTQFSISPPSYAPAAAVLKTMEKKSPVPTSKILNVPATYALPGAGVGAVGFAKTTSYLPQASPHYHTPYVRPSTFAPGSKTPQQGTGTTPGGGGGSVVSSPLKYQTPPTTYPPPIEAYQCPKINPNFLTPKYDRSSVLPRTNNNNSINNNNTSSMNSSFTSPRATLSSLGGGTVVAGSVVTPVKSVLPPPPVVSQAQSLNLSLNAVASTSAAAAAAVQQQQQQQHQQQHQQQSLPQQSQQQQQQQQQLIATPVSTAQPAANAGAAAPPVDPLKDEIGSILAQATLMPSKEESGKIFGIASVSLAQSSGPDNTKCTLGKCGSIHKPVLGPVVPTEGYFGDQLTSKERRKAKVNMTHEQIQKWLIECSSNPDEIQDDLDDEFDESLRPQQAQTPPGPTTRDDKESTSFSSSSNKTRGELGKSESAWSAKGPSLKATPVLVSQAAASAATGVGGNRSKDAADNESDALDFDKCVTPVNLTQKSQLDAVVDKKLPEKKAKNASAATAPAAAAATTTLPVARAAAAGSKRSAAAAAAASNIASPTPTKSKAANKKQANAAAKLTTTTTTTPPPSNNNPATPTTPAKRTPIYQNQSSKSKAQTQLDNKQQQLEKQQQQLEKQLQQLSEKNTTSVYAFGKEEETGAATTVAGKAANRKRNAADNEAAATTAAAAATPPPALSERSPTKKRAAAAAAATAVQLTLSPTDKLEKPKATAAAARQAKKQQQQQSEKQQQQVEKQQSVTSPVGSDAEGATFYIPLLQGASGGGEGGIQGVAVKLGREGPDGPNQKVVMQATLVTKAQMDTNSKPLPDNELVKTLLNAATTTSNDAATTTTTVTGSNSLKASTSAAAAAATSLVRVNSNSSLFSGSAKSRTAAATTTAAANATNAALAKKYKDDTPIKMANNTAFPRHDDPTQMVEAPIFKPTEKEFADPIEFIERITPIAARFGICKIIPPASFKPECRISDEMRFTAYNQYVHKMLHRWGPSAKELSAIKKYLATQSIVMNHAPWIGGMEVDLPRLYHTVQELGGLKEVIEKKKWARVAEEMCIPKLAQDRVTKLDDIYCKYLLPYDTLSPAERQKLFDEVEADWAKREARARRNADRFVNSTESVSNEEDDVSTDEDEESEEEIDGVSMECIVKGRSMPLSQFYRIARNTMALWFKSTDPTVNEVEAEFWRHVAVRDSHVCVHSGSIDSSGWGYGFPSPGPKGKGSNYARHPWNLKVLTNNAGSVLRSLGPVMGVTVPTLHVGMLFSACCWYRDPHGLSWIEYLHTGASKLWYGIPDDQSANFRSALTSLIPTHCQNKTIWLPCDTVMVPPHMLTDRGVSLCRIEQKPGEFIVVFPRAYTSSLATGYVVSESVYFATMSWLDLAKDDFRDIHESCEPAMFSLEQLLFALGYDQRVNSDTLQQMLPMLNEVCEKESAAREQLRAAGVTSTEKVQAEKGQKAKKQQQPPYKSIESECDLCRANLYISMVRTEEGNVYCLQHALKNLNNGNIQAKQCKLIYAYNVDDILQLIRQLQEKIQHKQAVKKK
ncbi:mucin-19 isoform X1 [Drosophila sulfurigaster albostrigata]|uniref:mucin-19 isoform X1 n=1 Tax=Drosophila sulfurigaster albostrigata TaxID=89887 RepID=UPI002D21B149|nr:mucin-19 isoform X1 [Drosophila sulfurigaster albostrigata]